VVTAGATGAATRTATGGARTAGTATARAATIKVAAGASRSPVAGGARAAAAKLAGGAARAATPTVASVTGAALTSIIQGAARFVAAIQGRATATTTRAGGGRAALTVTARDPAEILFVAATRPPTASEQATIDTIRAAGWTVTVTDPGAAPPGNLDDWAAVVLSDTATLPTGWLNPTVPVLTLNQQTWADTAAPYFSTLTLLSAGADTQGDDIAVNGGPVPTGLGWSPGTVHAITGGWTYAYDRAGADPDLTIQAGHWYETPPTLLVTWWVADTGTTVGAVTLPSRRAGFAIDHAAAPVSWTADGSNLLDGTLRWLTGRTFGPAVIQGAARLLATVNPRATAGTTRPGTATGPTGPTGRAAAIKQVTATWRAPASTTARATATRTATGATTAPAPVGARSTASTLRTGTARATTATTARAAGLRSVVAAVIGGLTVTARTAGAAVGAGIIQGTARIAAAITARATAATTRPGAGTTPTPAGARVTATTTRTGTGRAPATASARTTATTTRGGSARAAAPAVTRGGGVRTAITSARSAGAVLARSAARKLTTGAARVVAVATWSGSTAPLVPPLNVAHTACARTGHRVIAHHAHTATATTAHRAVARRPTC